MYDSQPLKIQFKKKTDTTHNYYAKSTDRTTLYIHMRVNTRT